MKKTKSWEKTFSSIAELGEGGNAKVYCVKELSTNNEFALKELCSKKSEEKNLGLLMK